MSNTPGQGQVGPHQGSHLGTTFDPAYAADEAKAIAKDLSSMVNRMNDDAARDLAELIVRDHRTLQQGMMRSFIVPLLRLWAEAAYEDRFDLRNEGTVLAAKEMVEALDESGIVFPFI